MVTHPVTVLFPVKGLPYPLQPHHLLVKCLVRLPQMTWQLHGLPLILRENTQGNWVQIFNSQTLNTAKSCSFKLGEEQDERGNLTSNPKFVSKYIPSIIDGVRLPETTAAKALTTAVRIIYAAMP